MTALDPVGLDPYDVVLLVSFGGPEGPEEVLPFLRRVTAGRGIPDERLAQVGEHYYRFGGRSPINDLNRALLADLRAEMDRRGLTVPLAWGNRNSNPLLTDVLPRLAADGAARVLAVTTSAYPSYSSCRQYRENLFDAVQPIPADRQPRIDRIRNYANHPAFVHAWAGTVRAALRTVPGARPVFVTHSIPEAMAEQSGPSGGEYPAWHRAVAAAVVEELRTSGELPPADGADPGYDLAYCSRSGAPGQAWLEPDVNDHLETLAARGVERVVLAPIGFIADHMEVIYDLDTEAAETARRLGLTMARAATVGTTAGFVAMLVDLMVERAALARGETPARPVLAGQRPGEVECPVQCCVNLRAPGKGAVAEKARQ